MTEYYSMGFGATPIAPGTEVVIKRRTFIDFQPAQLIIPADVAPGLVVVAFDIGDDPQIARPTSATEFGELPGEQSYIRARRDRQISLTVRNTNKEEVVFYAILTGEIR